MTQLRQALDIAASQGRFVPSAFAVEGPPSGFQPLFERGTPAGAFVVLTATEAKPTSVVTLPSAEGLLGQAREEAARLLAEAEVTARIRIEEGVAEAIDVARDQQLAAFTAASTTLLGDLRQQWEARLGQIEREAAALVVTIARRVLHEHFAADEAAILPLVREALRPLSDSQRVQVVIAPVHEAAVREAHRELAQVLRDEAQLEITVSESEAPFGCLAHGEQSSVDARLENRLDALQHVIEQTLISDAA